MKVKITKKELLILNEILGRDNLISGLVLPEKVRYAIKRTKRMIKDDVDTLNEILVPEKLKEYENKRIALVESLASKDEKGNFQMKTTKVPRLVNGQVVVEDKLGYTLTEENQKIFDEKFVALRLAYKETLDESDKNQSEKSMNEDIDVEVYTVQPTDDVMNLKVDDTLGFVLDIIVE